jgi:formamidopyrimidine-DNA glycosylase
MRSELSEAIDAEVRDSLCEAVHNNAGRLCPCCGSLISEVKRQRMATHFCRTCQPGLMVER